jgi:diguanylate cyclase
MRPAVADDSIPAGFLPGERDRPFAAGGMVRAAPAPAGVAIVDWDDLLSAVVARLRQTALSRVGDRIAPATSLDGNSRAFRDVLECVSVLDQLQASFKTELDRQQILHREVVEAHRALALARAELAGTRAGERRARHQSQHDHLTALPNRGFFRERLRCELAHAAARNRSIAVLYLDLDGFKPINDTHGHDTGDKLLRIIATRLKHSVRAEDMVSRLGGDEFGCVVADLPGREQLVQLACKLFNAVSAPAKVGERTIAVRPSIGIAVYPDCGTTADALIQSADAAMYHAKRHQSGYAFFG